MMSYLILFLAFVVAIVASAVYISFKASLLMLSVFSLLMFINVSLTTLGNAFIGRNIKMNYDIFWKMLFIILSSVGFGLYFNL